MLLLTIVSCSTKSNIPAGHSIQYTLNNMNCFCLLFENVNCSVDVEGGLSIVWHKAYSIKNSIWWSIDTMCSI